MTTSINSHEAGDPAACSIANPKLLLVGCLYTGSPEKMMPFLYRSFGELTKLAAPGSLTRQIQYESGSSDDDYIRFSGLEVSEITSIPERMYAWEIEGSTWTAYEEKDSQRIVAGRSELEWQWLDIIDKDKPLGEFAISWPTLRGRGQTLHRAEFRMVAHTWLGITCNDEITLVDYDPAWPGRYEQMRDEILKRMGPDCALRIEHYGSTSIPGMPAKPIIDILVEIPGWTEGRRRAIPAFSGSESEYWYYNDHLCFIIRDLATGLRTHHIHMAPAGHRLWEGLAFRDRLRSNPTDAARYLALKRELAEKYAGDREAYTNAKHALVREVTDAAIRGSGGAG